MAEFDVSNPHGVQAVGGNNRSGEFTESNLATISDMRTRLDAIDSGYYTADRLNKMTYNDMVYAIRLNDHASKVK